METGREYWSVKIEPPYSPSDADVEVYRRMRLPGSTLLLGCTHDLIGLSDSQLDIDPWYEADTVVVGDWRDNSVRHANIIGDGVLNLSTDLADAVIGMAGRCCDRLIVRSFTRRLEKMRLASNFPTTDDFAVRPSISLHKGAYSFFVWDFT